MEDKAADSNGHSVSNGNSSGVTSNGNGHDKVELSIYEQFQRQVFFWRILCVI